MNEFSRPTPYGQARPMVEAPSEKLAFLRRVYGLFTASLVTASLGAMTALYAGTGVSQLTMHVGERVVVVPPLVAFFVSHWIIGMVLFFGAFLGASALRFKPVVNVIALLSATFIGGIFLAPSLWYAQLAASAGHTLSAAPVRDAFLLAVLGFTGITTYALTSKRDFSFLRGFLSMGLWVLIGAMLIGMFVGSQAFSLAIASVGVLLFGGFILFNTSALLREDNRDPVGAALQLYLNFVNLFLFLLQILGSSRRSD